MTQEEKLQVLEKIAMCLNREQVCWGLGGSLMLVLRGAAEVFHDIDIMTTEVDAERVRQILSGMGTLQPPNPAAQYGTAHFYEFDIAGVDVDVMAGFTVVRDGETFDCPFSAERVDAWVPVGKEQVPLQSLGDWRRFYYLMNRQTKVDMIDRFLASQVTD